MSREEEKTDRKTTRGSKEQKDIEFNTTTTMTCFRDNTAFESKQTTTSTSSHNQINNDLGYRFYLGSTNENLD
jgi:hypothetical protein